MQIAQDSVVTFEYVLKDDSGHVIDSSEDGPMVYLHGYQQIVVGLERAMLGKQAGDTLKVVVAPADGYGEKTAGAQPIKVKRSELPPGVAPEEGMSFNAVAPNGHEVVLWVTEVAKNEVSLSLEHPLAGTTLHFDVTVKVVRAATKEELTHGHAHGPDGHHHH